MISKKNITISSNATILENVVPDDEMYFDFKTKIPILLKSCPRQMTCYFFDSLVTL